MPNSNHVVPSRFHITTLFHCSYVSLSLSIVAFVSFLDDLKDKHTVQYQKHQMHVADKNGRIKLEEVDIDKFAVKLKIRKDLRPVGNFRDEARNYLESLRSITSEDIELSQLFDNNKRVIFICAIAGLGKTVLSKQIITLWSRNEIYTDIKVCIMFECRDINVFRGTRGAYLETHEVLEEFVKTKFQFDLNDGKDVLFVIDGVDELVSTGNVMIKQLLNRNIYPDCKIIITGRPHVLNKLEECGEVGGMQIVEIQGLSEEQIEEYFTKFPFPEGVCVDLSRAKDSSNRFLSVLSIPQFINTFCCIASLSNFEALHNGAELYCWTIYLLLKQHAGRNSQTERKSIPEIFHDYSKELLSLGEVCHRLLKENKIIILKEEMKDLLGACERGGEFIGSLFVDVSDNFEKKLQFKHLTLMEFLSAFHIISSQSPLEIIFDNLRSGFLEVVLFACQLISGFNSRGIIQEMVNVNAAKLQQININIFCHDVIKALNGCKFDEKTKFVNSLDIINSCLNDDVDDKSIFLSTVQMLNTESVQTEYDGSNKLFKGIVLHFDKSNKLHTIYKHMVYACKCTEHEMRAAFKHIHVSRFCVNDFEMVECAKYFGNVNSITLTEMKLNVKAARREFESIDYGKCKVVTMFRCELEDMEIEQESYGSNLDRVVISECKIKNVSSILNAFQWAASSSSTPSGRQLALFDLKIEDGWWSELVTAIEKGMSNGKVKLRLLHSWDCTPQISTDLQRKVR